MLRARLLGGALVAALALGVIGLERAEAGLLVLEPAGFTEPVALGSLRFSNGATNINCDFDIYLELFSEVDIIRGREMAYFNFLEQIECPESAIGTPLEFAVSVQYQGFGGAPPNGATSVAGDSNPIRIQLITGTWICLYEGSLAMTVGLEGSNPYQAQLAVLGGTLTRVRRTAGPCPERLAVDGTFGFEPEQTLTIEGELIPLVEFEPGGAFSLPSLGAIALGDEAVSMNCTWSMGGSLEGAAALDPGDLIGTIRTAAVERCSGGSVSRFLNLPSWGFVYTGVTGEWPTRATAISMRITNFAVELATIGAANNCLYGGALTGTWELSGSDPYATGLLRLTDPVLRLVSGGRACPASLTARGTFWVGPEQVLDVL